MLDDAMAKDDYHVIVYQILAYLYTQLKAGEPVDPKILEPGSKYLSINERYWSYIMKNLVQDGLISGVVISKPWGESTIVAGLEYAMITPRGIEYLTDNSFLIKAKEFLKDLKAIVPFV